MSEVIVPLPDPTSDAFPGALATLIHSINNTSLPDFTIRQYLRAIFTCAIKYNHSTSISFLFQLSWFDIRLHPFVDILDKLLRWYRGKGKECTLVCYTLLAESFINSENQMAVIESTLKLLENRYDHKNFPHKNRPQQHHQKYIRSLLLICESKPCLREALLEIILQKLSTFDTQIKAGDNIINRPFFEDSHVLGKEREQTDLEIKLDNLLIMILDYIKSHSQIKGLTQELLLIFHRKILLMGQNKYIQYIMFYASESKKQVAGYFLSILINTLIEQNQVSYRKAYINNTFYLGSYLVRARLSDRRLKKAIRQIISYMMQLLSKKQQIKIQNLLLSDIVQQNQHLLYVYQTLVYVFANRPEIYKQLQAQFNPLYEASNKKFCADILLNSQILYRFNKICKGSQDQYSEPDSEYLTFENKFNPILLQKLRSRIQPHYINYDYQSVYENLLEIGKRKRCYSIQNRIQKKLKMFSQQHNSQASTMYNVQQLYQLVV